MTGRVHSIESFGLVDGPGVRSIAFLQGCNLRCRYCHNPDTWVKTGGTEWEAEVLFQKLYRFKPYWKKNGGITVSGGEALLQMEFVTDLFILDLKEMDSEKHKALTGQDNRNILELARYLSAHGKSIWIRHVLVPGLTDSEDGLEALHAFLQELRGVERVEILPYHTMGVHKWEALGIPYSLTDVLPPSAEEVKWAEKILNI